MRSRGHGFDSRSVTFPPPGFDTMYGLTPKPYFVVLLLCQVRDWSDMFSLGEQQRLIFGLTLTRVKV